MGEKDENGRGKSDPLKGRLIAGVLFVAIAVAFGIAGAAWWVLVLVGGVGIYQLAVAAIGIGVREGRRS